MPDYKPNQFVRAFAVLALIAAFVLVIAVVATSNGGGDSGNGDSHKKTHISKAGRRAVHKGVWIVHPGDTLGAISLKTGIDQATLQALNPDIDPQTLLEGQRIALR
jgi:LysM repeat protein